MKARQSKKARDFFKNEANGRALLQGIYKAQLKNSHVDTKMLIDGKIVRVKEL